MLVAHNQDYDTHAVVGGSQVKEFGIAQTAEFFTILSDTLYSDKPLAVIREVLCNAWDAHIASNRTDIPVIVTIDDDKISIKDFGYGIPHDLIHGIYCVYGMSTKTDDGNQTGGFGLGSKAPFSYSNHFTVINEHEGTKVVHAISRGSTLTNGKPDRRVMVSISTTSSGIEVIIPVKNPEDKRNFIKIANDIASFGEMNVLINNKEVKIVPISKSINNLFAIVQKSNIYSNKLSIKYGNVVYPVDYNTEYSTIYNKLMEQIEFYFRNSEYYCNFIMQAAPNTIAVTPSRESISITEMTVNTLTELMTKLYKEINSNNSNFTNLLKNNHNKIIDKMILNNRQDELFNKKINFSKIIFDDNVKIKKYTDGSYITNLDELAEFYSEAQSTYPDKLYNEIRLNIFNKLIEINHRSKNILKKFTDFLKKYYKLNNTNQKLNILNDFYQNEIFKPLVKKVYLNKNLNINNLYVYDYSNRHSFGKNVDWVPIIKFLNSSRIKNNPPALLKKVIVLSYNKTDFYLNFTNVYGYKTLPVDVTQEVFIYICSRLKNSNNRQEAINYFTKLGYLVIDYAQDYENYFEKEKIENPHVYATLTPRNNKAKLGLPKLIDNVKKTSNNITIFDKTNHRNDEAPRYKDYDYVVKPENLSQAYDSKFFPWGDSNARKICRLYGNKIGICNSITQYNNQIENHKKKDGFFFISESVTDNILNSPNIKDYIINIRAMKEFSSSIESIYTQLVNLAKYSSVIKNELNFKSITLTETELDYLRIQNEMYSSLPYYDTMSTVSDDSWKKKVIHTNDIIKSWEKEAIIDPNIEKICSNNRFQLVNLKYMGLTLANMDKSNPDYSVKVAIETTVIQLLRLT